MNPISLIRSFWFGAPAAAVAPVVAAPILGAGLRNRDPRFVGPEPTRAGRLAVLIALIDVRIDRIYRHGAVAQLTLAVARAERFKKAFFLEMGFLLIDPSPPPPPTPCADLDRASAELDKVIAAARANQAARRDRARGSFN